MKQFFKSLKLLKYGLQLKTMLMLTVLFFVGGILMEIFLSGTGTDILSGMYLAISGIYVYQLLMTPSISSLVQTSSFRRNLQTKYPMIMTVCTTLFTFTVFVVIRVLRISKMGGRYYNELTREAAKGILITAILAAMLLIYMGVCFKKYILSFVILFAVAITLGLTGTVDRLSFLFDSFDNLSYPVLIGLSYALILAGGFLGWIVSLLCYRMPIDALSVRAALRQAQAK